MKETYVTFCLIKLNQNFSPKFSWGGLLFCAEVRPLLLDLIFTHFVPDETVAMK